MTKVVISALDAIRVIYRSDQKPATKNKLTALKRAGITSFITMPFLALMLVVFCFVLPASADPPARIGRINYLNGSVSFQRGDIDEWVDASVNYPLTTGDHLWADDNSRAELHVGSTAIRLNNDTELSFLNLDDDVVQIRLS